MGLFLLSDTPGTADGRWERIVTKSRGMDALQQRYWKQVPCLQREGYLDERKQRAPPGANTKQIRE